MRALFPRRCPPHRRRAAWSAWWAGQRSLAMDQRFVRSPAFEPFEDDWLRLTQRGIRIGTTGFMAPDGESLAALPEPWPLHGGYFEKQGLWVRGADPLDWIGSGRGFGRRQRQAMDVRPQTVGIVLNRFDDQDGFTPLDRSGTTEVLAPWSLPGTPHRFNPAGTPRDVAWILEQRPRGRVDDDHPVFHAFGPEWWTREQVEAAVTVVMEHVRERLSDGQWIDPAGLPHRLLGATLPARTGLIDRLSDLIDHRDLRSDDGPVLPSAGDRQTLVEAGGERLLHAVEQGWSRWTTTRRLRA